MSERPVTKTYKLPALFRDLVDVLDWFHKGLVAYGNFWDPDGADEMRPAIGVGLLKGTLEVGAEQTRLTLMSMWLPKKD